MHGQTGGMPWPSCGAPSLFSIVHREGSAVPDMSGSWALAQAALTAALWQPELGSRPSRKTCNADAQPPAVSYHRVRAPWSRLHSAARTCWLRHNARPSLRNRRFRASTARRRRCRKLARVSLSTGSRSSNYSFNLRHQPSMALKSGEHFGNWPMGSQPASPSASTCVGSRKNRS